VTGKDMNSLNEKQMGSFSKKAFVSTFCEWNSFGSVLQAIGLRHALDTLGIESVVVKVMPHVTVRKSKGFKTSLKKAYAFVCRKTAMRAYEKCKAFIKRNVQVCAYRSQSELIAESPERGIYIAGSDQIWSAGKDRGDFFLCHAPQGSRRISYAASMVRGELPEEEREWLRENLGNFDCISVRERQMLPLIEELAGKSAQVHIDPTFLKSADEWRELQSEYKVKKPYILVYPLYWDRKFNTQLKELKRKTGLQIISVHAGLRNIYADYCIQDADPGEFLWLVDHAERVITSSFHGVAFSIIFNKKFSAIINPNAPARISNLLEVLGIEIPSVENCMSSFDVDYEIVNQRIREERARGMSYLRRELLGEE